VSSVKIQQLTIFGVGLIGGSLAKALKKVGYCQKIIGCSRNIEHLQQAVDLKVIDAYTLDPLEAVKDAEMILLAVPLGAMESILRLIKPALSAKSIITDAGSAKSSVIAAVERVFPEGCPQFVAGHPIAGREQSGVAAAISDLYHDRRTILTPIEATDRSAVKAVKAMWQAAGARVEIMQVEQHDQVLAATSHLPHLLAYNLVHTLSQSQQSEDIFRYAAGGFKDFTRIASSDPIMWRDICSANRSAILAMIATYQESLNELADLIERDDTQALTAVFSQAKNTRDQFLKTFK
jgi:prephenate dehydrogenase